MIKQILEKHLIQLIVDNCIALTMLSSLAFTELLEKWPTNWVCHENVKASGIRFYLKRILRKTS